MTRSSEAAYESPASSAAEAAVSGALRSTSAPLGLPPPEVAALGGAGAGGTGAGGARSGGAWAGIGGAAVAAAALLFCRPRVCIPCDGGNNNYNN